MSLSQIEAEKLYDLGFRRAEYASEQYPQDVYEYEGARWVLGGRIIPETTILCDEAIFKKGVWLPSVSDLFTWLEDNDCKYVLSYNGLSYKIEVTDSEEKYHKGKGATVPFVLYKVISQILKEYGGSPVQKTYEVIEAEFIGEEDL